MSLGVGLLNPEGILWSSLRSRHTSGSKRTVTSRISGKKWVYGRAGQRPRMAREGVSVASPSESVPSVASPSESIPAEATEFRVAFGFGVRPMMPWPGHWKPGERGSWDRLAGGTMAEERALPLPSQPDSWALYALGEEAVCVGAGIREGSEGTFKLPVIAQNCPRECFCYLAECVCICCSAVSDSLRPPGL